MHCVRGTGASASRVPVGLSALPALQRLPEEDGRLSYIARPPGSGPERRWGHSSAGASLLLIFEGSTSEKRGGWRLALPPPIYFDRRNPSRLRSHPQPAGRGWRTAPAGKRRPP